MHVDKFRDDDIIREEPITGMQNPYDMASYAQNYSDTIEWLYQKNRLSK